MSSTVRAEENGYPVLELRAVILILSFVPFLIKSVSYLVIGGYTPAIVFCVLAALVIWGVRHGGVARRRAIRTWAVAIVLWAVARFTVYIMFALTSVSEAAIEAHLTPGYLVVSAASLAIGVYLFRTAATRNGRTRA